MPEPLLENDEQGFERSRATMIEAAREGVRTIGEMYEAQVDVDSKAPSHDFDKQETRSSHSIEIFISHNSRDADIAEMFVRLLRDALPLKIEDIRCTSVPGHTFMAGANIDDQVREEVLNARVFIGLLTPNSLKSTWVLFELGARWLSEKPMIPILANGLTADDLNGPLPGRIFLDSNHEEDLFQFVGDVARFLKLAHRPAQVYNSWIRKILEHNSQFESDRNQDPSVLDASTGLVEMELVEARFFRSHTNPQKPPPLYELFLAIRVRGLRETVYLLADDCNAYFTFHGENQPKSFSKLSLKPNGGLIEKASGNYLVLHGPGQFLVETTTSSEVLPMPEGYQDKIRIEFECSFDGSSRTYSFTCDLTYGEGKGHKSGGDWTYSLE